MNTIYWMHIRAMWRGLIPFSVALLLVFIVGNIVFHSLVAPWYFEKESLKKNAFSYVFESKQKPQNYQKVLQKLTSLVIFEGPHQQQINAYMYIQSDSPFPISDKLQQDEIAVSKKMASQLGVTVGDWITAQYMGDNPLKEYKVKEILPYMSDFYDVQESKYFSVAIVGNDALICSNMLCQWVYFAQEQDYQFLRQKNFSYHKRRDIKVEIETLTNTWVLGNIVWGCILGVLAGCVIVWGHIIICAETLKFYYEGFDANVIKRIEWADHLLFLGIPIAGELFWMIFHYEQYVPSVFGSVVFGFLLFLILLVWYGGRKYGKVA